MTSLPRALGVITVIASGACALSSTLAPLARAAERNATSHLATPCVLPLSNGLERRLRRLGAEPHSLAAADLDWDGVPDLIAGYAGNHGGMLAVFRGNERSRFPSFLATGTGDLREAAAPNRRGAWACPGLAASPFDPADALIGIRGAPDFLETGDFDGDGARDVVVGTRGATALTLLLGDGKGAFRKPVIVALGGRLTAMASGDAGVSDGRKEFAAAIVDDLGPRLLLFAGTWGKERRASASLALPESGTALAFAPIASVTRGAIFVGAGSHVLVVESESHGEDTGWRVTADRALDGRVLGVATDTFMPGAGRGVQIAAVTEAGSLAILRRVRLRARTDDEIRIGARGTDRFEPLEDETSYGVSRFDTLEVETIEGWAASNDARSGRSLPAVLRSLKTTTGGTGRDLLFLNDARLHLFGAERDTRPASVEAFRDIARTEVVAALPLRLNQDALDDLVLLERGRVTPMVSPTVPEVTFTVNTSLNAPDDAVGNGICHTALPGMPKCSLLAAIQEANVAAGVTNIVFNLGSGTPTINASGFGLQRPVTIDGATGGATRVRILGGGIGMVSGNGACALRSLVLEGTGNGTGLELGYSSHNIIENCIITNFQNGIHLSDTSSTGNTIGGSTVAARNVISSNSGYGILSDFDSYGNTIAGNFIGTSAAGDTSSGNGIGIEIWADFSGSRVGGETSAPGTPPGNVISGNGIGILTVTASNTIQGNLIGLRADGTGSLGNGIGIQASNGLDLVGGAMPAARNVISGNTSHGIEVGGLALYGGVGISGNDIGTGPDGVTPAPNGGNGILSHGTAVGIGANVIAFNSGAGVLVDNGNGTAISSNSIHSNGGLGIDLSPVGPTKNDAGDTDSGPNGLQNFPVLTKAVFNGSSTTIDGVLSSAPNVNYKVELFGSSESDPSGFGEGRAYLANALVTTDGSGAASFSVTVPGNVSVLTATATTQVPFTTGNSSEFSLAFVNPGEASRAGNLDARRGIATSVDLTYAPACGATKHAVYIGTAGPAPLGGIAWSGVFCGLGVSGVASFDPGSPAPGRVLYFVVVGQTEASEGSYGRGSSGIERPEATGVGACDVGQSLTASCDP